MAQEPFAMGTRVPKWANLRVLVSAGAQTHLKCLGAPSPHLPWAAGASYSVVATLSPVESNCHPGKDRMIVETAFDSLVFINSIPGALRRRSGPLLCSSLL